MKKPYLILIIIALAAVIAVFFLLPTKTDQIILKLEQQEVSDEIEKIEMDLGATELDSLDQELLEIEKELNL